MDFINLRSVFNRKVSAKNPLLFIYKTVGRHSKTTRKSTKPPFKIQNLKFICIFWILTYLCSLIQIDNNRHVNRIQHRKFPVI